MIIGVRTGMRINYAVEAGSLRDFKALTIDLLLEGPETFCLNERGKAEPFEYTWFVLGDSRISRRSTQDTVPSSKW